MLRVTPSPDTLVQAIGDYPDVAEILHLLIAVTAHHEAKQLWANMSIGSSGPDPKTIRS
jgi:hypothetical protein